MGMKLLAFLLGAVQALFFPIAGLITTGKLTTAALDCVPDTHYSEAADTLCDPLATAEAKQLMQYLKAQYGNHILSGQFVSPYEDYAQPQFRDADGKLDARLTNELAVLHSVNGGKYPAILGLDFTGAEFSAQWDDWVTQLALQWHELGGIVTFCWHWLVPQDVTKPCSEWSRWASAIYGKDTNFNLRDALADKNSAAYQWLTDSIARVAVQLRVLQDAGVPVLWRPLHEAAGGWFWWGAAGKDAYLELYHLIFDSMTGEHGLHNLIWVWNGQNPNWYPGDTQADILSDDPYALGDNLWLYPADPGRSLRFKYTRRASGSKMAAISENDTLPSLDFMWNRNTKWLFFCGWDRERLLLPDPNNQPYGLLREFSDQYNSAADYQRMYHDARVLTLDDLR